MKTIEYPLAATTLKKRDIDQILVPIINTGLSRSGICQKTARSVVFAPNHFHGLGVHHAYDTQGIRKVEVLFQNNQILTTKLVETSWQRTIIESGYGYDFLAKDGSKIIDILTNGWITSLWEFLSASKINIKRTDHCFKRTLRHTADSYIMEDICRCIQWNKKDKLKFNYCRLYLRVELLSDITNSGWKSNTTVSMERN
jgi:hypothetical protein